MMIRRILYAAIFALAFVPAAHAQRFQADSGINISSSISTNDTNAIVISTKPGTVYQVDAYANGTTLAYIKLYDATTATCGSGTPKARYLIPYGTASSGGGFVTPNINGDAYAAGIVMCITTGIADSDTGAPAANAYIVNLHWKSNSNR